jgi:hypothetical protein
MANRLRNQLSATALVFAAAVALGFGTGTSPSLTNTPARVVPQPLPGRDSRRAAWQSARLSRPVAASPSFTWRATSRHGRAPVSLLGAVDGDERGHDEPEARARPAAASSLRDALRGLPRSPRQRIDEHDLCVDFAGYQVIYVVAAKGTGAERSPAFLDYPGGGIDADGNELRYGATFFEDTKLDARYAANVLIHETGHVLGIPDLYDVPDPRYWSLFRFAGGWDVMSWNDPGFHFLAWEKWKLGWLEPPQIACLDGAGTMTATVTPLERAGGLKAIVLPVGPLLCSRDRSPSPNRPGPMALRRRRPSLHGRRVGTKRLRPCAYPSRGAGPELESPRPLRSALQRPALAGTWVATLANRADGISVTVLGSGPTGYRVRVSRT